MENDRRNFLVKFSGITAAAVATPVLIDELAPAAQAAAYSKDGRSYVAGRFALELDGLSAGSLSSAEGGHATADVVVEPVGADGIAKKHLGGVKYEDISIQCGYGMSNPFYDWLSDSISRKVARKDGALIAADFNRAVVSYHKFFHALITEIGMPALDAASKDAAKMTIKFSPEYTRFIKSPQKWEPLPSVQKTWLPSNFRLKIDGLENACARVNKIEALTIKQKVAENPTGEQRDYEKEPADVEIPNLVITFPESHAEEFYAWHEDFVIKGNCGDEQEKTGSLEYLSSRGESLFKLDFHHLGIFKLAPEPVEPVGENIRRIKAEMYCEHIKFSYTPAWV